MNRLQCKNMSTVVIKRHIKCLEKCRWWSLHKTSTPKPKTYDVYLWYTGKQHRSAVKHFIELLRSVFFFYSSCSTAAQRRYTGPYCALPGCLTGQCAQKWARQSLITALTAESLLLWRLTGSLCSMADVKHSVSLPHRLLLILLLSICLANSRNGQ